MLNYISIIFNKHYTNNVNLIGINIHCNGTPNPRNERQGHDLG